MTKSEFATKLVKYEKKQTRTKWVYFILGIPLVIFAFIPNVDVFINESLFWLPSMFFACAGGFYLSKAWDIKVGTEEHELLIDALNLLSDETDT
ncbi:hypothetical protein [Colwellia sp. Bg11-12]|jgi:hypothetical protein|uniref:hypothetical protein n=1 Tax=Colwellia sp. Bg11-12 TaxID=2759817 RepID=UPI0015F6800E|nr:hypothetical protein [Colwellia sp. Bg11-12]MBA6262217.1 hypothetical protein [Colwellia sp. Bg11-12]